MSNAPGMNLFYFLEDVQDNGSDTTPIPHIVSPPVSESANRLSILVPPIHTIAAIQKSPNRAIFDSGCSRHILGANFVHLITNRSWRPPLNLHLPDGQMYTLKEEVTVTTAFQTKDGPVILELHNIIFIEQVTQFLISI